MARRPCVSESVQMVSDVPVPLTLEDLARFVTAARVRGVRPDAGLWIAGADGQRDQLLYGIVVRHTQSGKCAFRSAPGAGGGPRFCESDAAHRMEIPARDGSSNRAGAQIQDNYHGEGTVVQVCDPHAKALRSRYGAVYLDGPPDALE